MVKMQLKSLQINKLQIVKDMNQNGLTCKDLYAHEDTITPIIMHCKASTPKAVEFRSKLVFKQQ